MGDHRKQDTNKLQMKREPNSDRFSRPEKLLEWVRATAEVVGAYLSSDGLLLIVSDLSDYSDEQIYQGLKRCRQEIKPEKGFVVFNLAILLEKMGVPSAADREKAEAEAQWELLNEGLRFYSGSPGCYWVGGQPNLKMSCRGQAALKRIGGMSKLESWAEQSEWHFTKKEFLKSYADQPAVDLVKQLNGGTGSSRGTLARVSEIIAAFPKVETTD